MQAYNELTLLMVDGGVTPRWHPYKKPEFKTTCKLTVRAARWLSDYHCCLTAKRSWVYMEFTCSSRVCGVRSGHSVFLTQSKDMQVRIIGNYKIFPQVWMWAWMVVWLHMSALWWTGDLFRVYPTLAQCQLGLTPAMDKWKNNCFIYSCIL